MKAIILLLISALLLGSCEKLVLGKAPTNNPETTFDLLWKELDMHYGLFSVRKINWDSLKAVYRPKISNTISKDQLWNVCCELIENLDDSHTVLFKENDDTFYISGYTLNRKSKEVYNKDLITNTYLENRTTVSSELSLSYGKIKNREIGYIQLGAQDGKNPAVIDKIINELSNTKSIIIDLRQNRGGDDVYSKRIAGAFADNENLVYTVQTRNGKKHTDFDAKTNHYNKKASAGQYVKPVIILTDRRTISAGEVFLLHMKSFAQVKQIGDTTAGDFSNVSNRKFLPNAWSFQYSFQQFLLPNGKSLDGIGHIPDVYVKNQLSDLQSGKDAVIDKALEYLFTTHGF